MQSFNHVAGGFAFTGIFASFADVNIFERFDMMAVVWVAAVLPDIDHTKSLSGKVVYPLAKWLQTKYGHRTITHSIFFYLAVIVVTKGFDNLFHQQFTLPVALALGSHLIFDMCTKQGIPIFYPFSRRPAVLPANPKLRLSANDFRSEAILFGVFCCLNVFSYPLMAQGFWARYNQGFATYDHLSREVKRKPGDYVITVLDFAKDDTIAGLLVEQKADELILFHEKKRQFVHVETGTHRLLNFIRRRHYQHELVAVNLINVSTDSLNRYMALPVVKVTVQSEQEIYYAEGPIIKKGKELSADYPNGARFQQVAVDNSSTKLELRKLELKQAAEGMQYAAKVAELKQLKQDLYDQRVRTQLSDYEEGKRRTLIRELNEKIAAFEPPERVNEELYRVERLMLEHKLQETSSLNAYLLIWTAYRVKNLL